MKRIMYLSISTLCLMISLLIGFMIGSKFATAQSEAYNKRIMGYSVIKDENKIYHYIILNDGLIFKRRGERAGQWTKPKDGYYYGKIGNFFEK